jgi:penicillin-binding protein 2
VAVPALPAGARRARLLFSRLGRLLGMSARGIYEDVVRGTSAVVYAPVTIKTDAGIGVLTEIGERANEYPGVIQEPVAIRSYPYGQMAANVLGYVGSVSKEELKNKAFRGVPEGTIVGQEGLEYYYDRYLRGKSGTQRVEVNAEGYPVPSKKLAPTPPEAGRSLRVTLDMGLQQEAEKALTEAKENAQAGGKPAVAGAFIAMDPRNGEILAAGSAPSFDPNRFARPLSEAEYKEIEGGGSEADRLVDRAVEGEYPTGSTFKPITAMAALEAGVLSPDEGLGAGTCIQVHGSGRKFCNANMAEYGAVGLVTALKVSSDTYFYEVGERTNTGPIIQQEARKLGIGRPSNIDLPNEFEGVIPDAAWRQKQNEAQERCEHSKHSGPCQIVAEIKPWTIGENMNLAVGQGDLLTDPLQMAVAYSTLANAYTHGGEGWAPTPHLGKEIDEANGGLVQSLSVPAARPVKLNDGDLNLVMEGIHEAASQSGGTSAPVWVGWNQEQDPVYGKTGTAEHVGKEDQSWYMCYIGNASRPIVIAVTVEQGGYGAETAAPVARLMASEYYGKPLKFVAGSSKTF